MTECRSKRKSFLIKSLHMAISSHYWSIFQQKMPKDELGEFVQKFYHNANFYISKVRFFDTDITKIFQKGHWQLEIG